LAQILIFFDRKGAQDQAIFLIGDKSLKQNDQAGYFVNRKEQQSLVIEVFRTGLCSKASNCN